MRGFWLNTGLTFLLFCSVLFMSKALADDTGGGPGWGTASCLGTCPGANAVQNAGGVWTCSSQLTCEVPPGETWDCTDCIINQATIHLRQPTCRCKVE